MQLLFRLPLTLLEMVLRRGLGAIVDITGLLRGGDDDAYVVPTPQARTAAPTYHAPPPPTAQEAIDRSDEREAAAPPPPPAPPKPRTPPARTNGGRAAAPRPSRARTPEPPAPEAAPPLRAVPDEGHVDREAELVESVGPAEDVVATFDVAEPWDGYDAMAANAIISRLRGADPATKGVVRLYEQQHKKRATVLRATG
jgi:hypothetical protein